MSAATPATPSKGLHIALWVVQILLAVAFGGAGLMKSTAALEELGKNMNWVAHTPAALVRFIGISEFLGALGLLLPSLTRIKPVLTPVAGAALVLVMALAAGFHIYLGEAGLIAPNFVLGGLAAFVAWGRFSKAPIAPKA